MAAIVILWVLFTAVALLILGLVRRTIPVLEALESRIRQSEMVGGLAIGSEIPSFEAMDASGSILRSSDLVRTPSVWVLMSSGCEPCERLATEIRESESQLEDVRLLVVTDEDPSRVPLPPRVGVFKPIGESTAGLFRTAFTPYALATDGFGIVRDAMIPLSVQKLLELTAKVNRRPDPASS